MKGNWWLVLVAVSGLAACSDDGPSGPGSPSIDFAVTAPIEVASKAVIDVNVEIVRASGVQYPLVVVFEKANTGEPFFEVGSFFLQSGDRIAVARVPVLLDPRVRVTVRESSPAELSVSKTIAIDVLDFP